MSDSSKESVLAAQQDSLLHVAGEAVKKLLRDPGWETRLYEVMEDLGRTVDASRCYVFEKQRPSRNGVVLRNRAEWRSPDLPPDQHADTAHDDDVIIIDQDIDLHWLERLTSGERVHQLDEDCPRQLREVLRSRNVKSLIVAPVFADSDWWGCIGLDDCTAERVWTESEQSALHIVADALGAAVERRTVEHERARVSAIIENSDDAIIAKTLDGTVTNWSTGAERIYGYTVSEMLGNSITQIIPPDRHDEFKSIMAQLQAGEPVDHHETERVRKDGSRIIVSVTISPVEDYRGRPSGAVTIARDITESRRAEIELRASEERLRLALEAGAVGAWDWELDSGRVIWSDNMERLHGLEPGAFGGTFEEFKRGIHPDDVDAVDKSIHHSLNHLEEYQIEYRSLMPDGGELWLAARGQVIADSRGRPVRMTGICTDISERKRIDEVRRELLAQLDRARAQAERERNQLEELFQHAPAMMALLEGPELVFKLANDRYLSGIGGRDVLGKPIREAVPELSEQGLVKLLEDSYQSGETIVRSELPVYLDIRGNRERELRYFNFAYQPTRDVDGMVTGVLVHAIDLTEQVDSRKRVEELARTVAAERDRLQQIIDVSPEAIAITDESGAFVLTNEVARTIWGQPAPEGDYRSYTAFPCYRPDETPYEVEDLPLSRSILQGVTVLGEQLLIQNIEHGHLVPVLVNTVPLRDEEGRISGAVAVFQDITPLKEFERQKDEFLQAVSHDLKNPLTTISGYSQLLRRVPMDDPERIQAAIGNMESATSRAIALLDEILDVTRLQMGRPLELTSSSVDLVELVKRIAEQHQATTELHEVIVESEEPELFGEFDAVRLERVLANLLTNAITYSPDGGRVLTRVRQEERDGEPMAAILVEDEGLGIPRREIPRLFERFWRGSNVRDYYRGTGLGLAGVKAIVEAHGGDVSVDSVEGEGSTFTIRMPVNGLADAD